jgi:UDP-N-acetyl-D-mannosaminuronic acid dehydrogenase
LIINIEKGNNMLNWKVEKIGVIGPGIVGMPMAALLANAKIKIGNEKPAEVVVIQRNSKNSGWKVRAINSGKSVIGGIEPELDKIVKESFDQGLLRASYDFNELSDADVILVSVQTDKKGFEPDYGPLFGALTSLAEALVNKPKSKVPIIVFESTLAPSSMQTVIRSHFEKFGLIEGKDILLGNSPNRVMPGRLVERVRSSDKLVGGLQAITSQRIRKLYEHIVTEGELFETNSLTAEIEKTFENAYRDVRIAFSAEVVRYCDKHDVDYYQLREKVNERLAQSDEASHDPNAVPTGGLLIPTIGVGGHCLPKDGILLWWRKIEKGEDTSQSLILKSREINNASPLKSIALAEKHFGILDGKKIALMGAAYRFNSEDTRNSPTLALGKLLLDKNCEIIIHDPYVKPDDQNLLKYQLQDYFTNDMDKALQNVDYLFVCTAHQLYVDSFSTKDNIPENIKGVFDGCHYIQRSQAEKLKVPFAGIGKGSEKPSTGFVDFIYEGFNVMDKGVANEVLGLIEFFNEQYADSDFNKADYGRFQMLAKTCSTGCEVADPGIAPEMPVYEGFVSELLKCATNKEEK